MADLNSFPLLSLPNDILVTLPEYLHDIEDYKNLSSTCRTLRNSLSSASPNTMLRLAAAASRTFFRPSPYLLVAATARQLGEWARLSLSNEETFADTCSGGIDAMLELCLEHCGITMDEIRYLYETRLDPVNPVTDLIDKCIGAQWYATENFWNGGVDDAYTIDADPPITLFHLAIYGELFSPDFDIFLGLETTEKRMLKMETRLEYIKYCVPDWACDNCQSSARDLEYIDGVLDRRRLVLATGPYEKTADGETTVSKLNGSQIGLKHMLESSQWNPPWTEARAVAGPDFANPMDLDERGVKQDLWMSVSMCQGLEGLKMIRPSGVNLWKERLAKWRIAIDEMQSEPKKIVVGRAHTYNFPFLYGDLDICSSGYVLGT